MATPKKISEMFAGYKGLSLPGVNFTPVTRNLPNSGGSYTIPQPGPQSMIPTTPTPPPVPPTPPVYNQPTPPVPPTPPVTPTVDYSKYTDPATGRVLTPTEYADYMARKATGGDIKQYAQSQFENPDQSTEQMNRSLYSMSSAQGDIGSGATDPYKVGAESGIHYTPAQLSAIEKAYAGIYDPAIADVFQKLQTREKDRSAAETSKLKLAEMAQQHAYDVALKQTPSGTAGGGGGVYVPGTDPQVDAMAELIWNGKATMASVPKEYKMQVASAMQTYGNQINGKPTTTEIGKQKLTIAKKLLEKFDAGEGTGVVGRSRLFGGGVALPGGARSDFYSLGDQLMAIAQLDASKFLKGQGQVSDAERAILANAATSLKYNQSETLFRKTLKEMIDVLEGNIPPEDGKTEEKPQTMILNGQTLTLQADGTYE